MRILAIRFRNLNSLAGEWEVDFTDPAYTSDGIFAITGPTGAGKTTLLDAMCLALYRQTPRLGDITANSNEIMTRQTGDCFAEVTFSTQNGSYRAHWSQHKARKQADGKLQAAKHEIADAESGKIIDSKFGTVAKRIEEITGMDFGRFTQSMLLAQGGFDAFLRAGADDRAPILEKITGTAIYSVISMTVHECRGREDQQLNMLMAKQDGMRLLSPEAEAEIRKDESALTQQLSVEANKADTLRQQHQWKQRCLQLEQQRAELAQTLETWQQQDNAFKDQRERLADATRALELSATYATLINLREDQQQEQQAMALDQAKLPGLTALLETRLGQVEQLGKALTVAEQQLESARPLLKKVHVLDSRLADGQVGLQTRQKTLDEKLFAVRQHKANFDLATFADDKQAEQHYQHALKAAAQAQQQLDNITQGSRPAQWREQLDALGDQITHTDTLRQRMAEQTQQVQRHQQLVKDIQQNQAELVRSANTLAQAEEVLTAHKTTLRSLQNQRDLQQRIINLEAMRTELEVGEPCPLCGASDHPFADHAPNMDIDGLSQQIRALEKQVNASEAARNTAHAIKIQQSTTISNLDIQCRQIDQILASLAQEIQDACQRLNVDNSAEAVTERLQVLQKRKHEITRTLQEIDDLDAALKTCQRDLNLATLIREAVEVRDDLQQQQKKLQTLQTERHDLLQDKDPNQEEERLQACVDEAQRSLASAQQQLQKSRDQHQHLQQQTQTHEKNIQARAEKLQQTEREFIGALQQHHFDSEQAYVSALLPEPERKALEARSQALLQKGIELRSALARNREELDEVLTRALTNRPLDEIHQQWQSQEAVVSALREKLGALRQRLKDNDDTRHQQQTLAEKIDQQKIEVERWRRLHVLIGSNDGKKFRNFAQGLTFELMIQHANVQLQKMTDRYLLQRDQEQPLDLNVIDNYQAGEVRSTKNLSGGESFIVSLALALGLSRMASRNVRVDSLFLDEGFGTLDEDALDTALETLSSLQQEGKLIGVISHVSALKERIGTQIRVSPLAGGRSSISGPGCQEVIQTADQ
ncbi:MAG: AAA family ATPase [Pseudohongiella sp.]